MDVETKFRAVLTDLKNNTTSIKQLQAANVTADRSIENKFIKLEQRIINIEKKFTEYIKFQQDLTSIIKVLGEN